MSWLRPVIIQCNACGAEFGGELDDWLLTVHTARADARSAGWFYSHFHGDRCPEHKPGNQS